jgi:hypothetical protein
MARRCKENSIKDRQDEEIRIQTVNKLKRSNKSNSKKVNRGDSERNEKIVWDIVEKYGSNNVFR